MHPQPNAPNAFFHADATNLTFNPTANFTGTRISLYGVAATAAAAVAAAGPGTVGGGSFSGGVGGTPQDRDRCNTAEGEIVYPGPWGAPNQKENSFRSREGGRGGVGGG